MTVLAGTPAAAGFAMPAEWEPHERTLMAWPCRRDMWGAQLAGAKEQYAGVANAVAAFEPVTMVCATAADAAEAAAACTGDVTVIERPIDDSWLRDSGPIFVRDASGRRAGVHFGFNAWGEKFVPWDRDAAVGGLLVEHVGDPLFRAPLILEGGSICVDGAGRLVTTEQCLLHPSRNPSLGPDAITQHLQDWLGVDRVIWLKDGLVEDKDTDGHVDLVAAFTGPGRLLLQSCLPGDPNHAAMELNADRASGAGLDVTPFPLLARPTVAGEQIGASYLNFTIVNGAVIVPTAGVATDAEALERIAAVYPDREVVGVPGEIIAWGGGGPHCITQQVPAIP
ncbi:Agmatine deiminase [Paraconexibacter sp. AEG42_29]|uniref:Agmatine deiminase n=1 Tax=Paraconexibacter sp. AEG42_29 TaxID=2997339 RepID=A0AAU7ATC0_9ACTN